MHEMVTGFRNGSMKKFGNLGLFLDPFSILPGPSTCSSRNFLHRRAASSGHKGHVWQGRLNAKGEYYSSGLFFI